jgi:hypothetical protein
MRHRQCYGSPQQCGLNRESHGSVGWSSMYETSWRLHTVHEQRTTLFIKGFSKSWRCPQTTAVTWLKATHITWTPTYRWEKYVASLPGPHLDNFPHHVRNSEDFSHTLGALLGPTKWLPNHKQWHCLSLHEDAEWGLHKYSVSEVW